MGNPMEDRYVGYGGQQTAGEDDRLPANAVREAAEDDKERRRDYERRGDEQIRRLRVDFQDRGEEEEGVELPAVPHHRLTRRRAKQRQNHDAQVSPARERF